MTKKLWKIGDQICVFRKNEYCSFIKKIILGEENKLQLQSAKYIVASWIEWLKCDMFKWLDITWLVVKLSLET